MSTAALPDKKVGGSEIIFLHPLPLLLNLYISWGLLGNYCWYSKSNDRAQGSEFGNPEGPVLRPSMPVPRSQKPAEPLPSGPHPFLLAPGHALPNPRIDCGGRAESTCP